MKSQRTMQHITDLSGKRFDIVKLNSMTDKTSILKLNDTKLTDADLEEISDFMTNAKSIKLDGIQLRSNKLTDKSFNVIRKLLNKYRNLKLVDLSGNNLKDQKWKNLENVCVDL